MDSLFGAFNDHLLPLFGSASALSETDRKAAERNLVARKSQRQTPNLADVLPFPYVAVLRSLLEQGRIVEARNLLNIAGDCVPQDSKIRQALAPPRVKKSDKKGVDRTAEFRWLKRNSSRYRGQWVALMGDVLVQHTHSLKELLAYLNDSGLAGKPLIHRID